MEGRRVFIAINLPENIKRKLSESEIRYSELPAKWTKKDNLHITLVFLGFVRDEEIREICAKTEVVAKKNSSFGIKISGISYGPTDKKPPRMVWALGEKSEALAELQSGLEDAFFGPTLKVNNKIDKYIKGIKKPEAKAFAPHITLARLMQSRFNQLEPEEVPEIKEKINLSFSVDSIEIMESELKKGGPQYTILESIPLGN
jgi:2'-5' RNA ligase